MTCKHRMSSSPEWLAWRNMRARCSSPTHPAWDNYGGRGIRVAPEWDALDGGFERFVAHVGRRPSDQHELDRIDNDGHYEPGNVRWATVIEQARNRRGNRLLTAHGVTRTQVEWSEATGLSSELIAHRIRAGWSVSDAVSLPAGEGRRGGRPGKPLAEGLTVRQWSERSGIAEQTIRKRLDRGWSAERAVSEALGPGRHTGGAS